MAIISAFPGKAKPKLQSKTVSPSTSQQTVSPDSGYEGLSGVTVNAMKLQSKTATPTTSQQNIYPSSGYNGLGQVTVNAIRLQSKTATPSATRQTIAPDSGYNGLSSVTVNAVIDAYDYYIYSDINDSDSQLIIKIPESWADTQTYEKVIIYATTNSELSNMPSFLCNQSPFKVVDYVDFDVNNFNNGYSITIQMIVSLQNVSSGSHALIIEPSASMEGQSTFARNTKYTMILIKKKYN